MLSPHPPFIEALKLVQLRLCLNLRELIISNMPPLLEFSFSLISQPWDNHSPPSETPMPKQNTLVGLPTELLLPIAELLLREDVTCLSLCNRRLFATFHPRNDSMMLSRKQRLSLLYRLERDMPSYFICYCCYRLQRYDASKCSGPSTPPFIPLPHS